MESQNRIGTSIRREKRAEQYRFRLNMQMLADALEDELIEFSFEKGKDEGHLTQVNFYRSQEYLDSSCVYLALAGQLPGFLQQREQASLIVIGTPPSSYLYGNFSLIVISGNIDLFRLYEIIQKTFEKNQQWNDQMQAVLNSNGGIEELCELARDYFQNPLFVHNAQFYIVACPIHQSDMSPWDYDDRTGLYMMSAEVINSFKVSPVYVQTLTTKGAQLFPADQVGFAVMYINIWNEFGRYEGRICIDELNTPFRKGQYLALEHLAKMIQVVLKRRNLEDTAFSRPFETFLAQVISKGITDRNSVERMLAISNWAIEDNYVCVKMALDSRDQEVRSVVSTCNLIEATVPASHAFSYENSIVTVINLSKGERSLTDCLNNLTYVVREGLLKTGISNCFDDFMNASYAYQQASLALYYGSMRQPTIWIHRYEQYVMDYIFDMACREMPAEFICMDKLFLLNKYDTENNTQLYQTLAVYMKNRQNAEQTAKELFLHRSTLFYRLRKIKSITGIDWADENERMYLQFSLDLLAHQNS